MFALVLMLHLLIAIALVGVILLQRSEGGALGIGGGGGMGGLMTGRGAANVLTRTTSILAAAFFATSIALSFIAGLTGDEGSILDTPVGDSPADVPGPAVPAPGVPTVPVPQ